MTKKTLFLGWSSGYPLQSQAKWPLYDASIGKQKETHLTENPHQRMIPNWVYSGMARRTHRNTKSVEGSFRHCIFTLWCCNFKTWIKHNPWRLWLQTAHSSSLPNVLNGQEEWSEGRQRLVTKSHTEKSWDIKHYWYLLVLDGTGTWDLGLVLKADFRKLGDWPRASRSLRRAKDASGAACNDWLGDGSKPMF
jgi:hypothetical protein